jgi:hypothetical protein
LKSGLSGWALALLSPSGSIAASHSVGFFCFSQEKFQRALNWAFVATAVSIPMAKLQGSSPDLWMPSIQISTSPVRVF